MKLSSGNGLKLQSLLPGTQNSCHLASKLIRAVVLWRWESQDYHLANECDCSSSLEPGHCQIQCLGLGEKLSKDQLSDFGFSYHVTKNGSVLISREGKLTTTLRGPKALAFINKMKTLSSTGQQEWMARLTGNYKRGNERVSKNHPRNLP
jgi:hypothetical protein